MIAVTYPQKVHQSLLLTIAAGCLLHLYTFVFRADGIWSIFVLGLAFSLTPYAVAAILAYFGRMASSALGFAAGALLGDLFMHYSVFIAPKSSTAALGLLFMPLWNLLLLGPIGMLFGWAIDRLIGKRSRKNEGLGISVRRTPEYQRSPNSGS